MELGDFFFNASLTLLISFLVLKLVSLATTDNNHTTTKHHVHVHDQPVEPVLQRLTVQTQTRVGFIKPVQVTTTTNLETVNNTSEISADSDSTVTTELPPTNSDATVESDLQETAVKSGDSTEQRRIECVEEISGVENDDDDWEWEGIERSEVEKTFMAATEFAAEKGYIGKCDDDFEMELYGLQRVAIEGPCREPQPMPLKLFARAKWNAWQKLGNMSPEVAMEQYISLISDKFPGWMKSNSAGMSEGEPSGSEVSESAAPDLSSAVSHRQVILAERKLTQEFKSGAPELIPFAESDSENNVKK